MLNEPSAYEKIDAVTERLRGLCEDEGYDRSVLSGYNKLHLDRLTASIAKPYLLQLTQAYLPYAAAHKKAMALIKNSRREFLKNLAALDVQLKKEIPSTARLTTRATRALLAGDMNAYRQAIDMGARFTKSQLEAFFIRALPQVKSIQDPLLARILTLNKLSHTEHASYCPADFDAILCHAIFRLNRSDLVPSIPISVYFSYRGHKWPTPPSDQAFAAALLHHGFDAYFRKTIANWPANLLSQLFSYDLKVIEYLYRNSKVLAPWCRKHPRDLLTWLLGSLNSSWPTTLLPVFAADPKLRASLADWSSYEVSTPSYAPRDVIALESVETTTLAIFADSAKVWLDVLAVFRSHFGTIKPPKGDAALVSVLAEKQTLAPKPESEPLTTVLNLV